MLLSFIIPLYNAAAYIDKCLQSIFSCGLQESSFEVIIVDDGSTDRSSHVVEKWMEKRSNIRLEIQSNRGASSARNRGLNVAIGEWIWFVDADDIIVPHIFENETLVDRMHTDLLDMICFNYVKDWGSHVEEITNYHEEEILPGTSVLRKSVGLYLWDRLFRRSSIKDIRFLEGTKNIEDFCFDVECMVHMGNVCLLTMKAYVYNQTNIASTTRNSSLENLQKLSEDTQTVHRYLRLYKGKLEAEKAEVVSSLLNFSALGYIYSLFTRYSLKDLEKGITFLRTEGLYPLKKTVGFRSNVFRYFANCTYLLFLCKRLRVVFLE